MLKAILARVADAVWPRDCIGCGRPSDRPGRYVCSSCLMRVPFNPLSGCCRVCGKAVAGMQREFLCEDCACASTRPHFDRAIEALRYEGTVRRRIHEFKYRGALWLAADFTDWIEGAARARFDVAGVDLVLSVPSTFTRSLMRGYNPSAVLARQLAARLDRRFCRGVLKRIGSPRRQAGLREDERRQNAVGTFRVRRPELVRGRTVLIVDDIMTTGSTLSAAAGELKAAGAAAVWCICLAHAVRAQR